MACCFGEKVDDDDDDGDVLLVVRGLRVGCRGEGEVLV